MNNSKSKTSSSLNLMKHEGSLNIKAPLKPVTPLPQNAKLLSEFSQKGFMSIHNSARPSTISKFVLPSSIEEYLGSSRNKLKKLTTKLEVLNQYSSSQNFDIDLGCPATRKDVQDLASWLNSMLQKALMNNNNPEILYETANTIYRTCFEEIIRQVRVQCKERGDLIKKVWEAYQQLFEHAIKIMRTKQEYSEKLYTTNLDNVEKNFSQKINELTAMNTKLLEEKRKLKKELKFKEDAIVIKQYREEKLLKALDIFKEQYGAQKEELLLVKEENRINKIRIENLHNIKDKVMKKYKHKSPEFAKKNIESDPIMNYDGTGDEQFLIRRISQYGMNYVEKFQEDLFQKLDFIDKETNTIPKEFLSVYQNTDVIELCGESFGVKTRRKRTKITLPKSSTIRNNQEISQEIKRNVSPKYNTNKELQEFSQVNIY